MTPVEIMFVAIGAALIALVLWNLRKGVAESNGRTPEVSDAWIAPDQVD